MKDKWEQEKAAQQQEQHKKNNDPFWQQLQQLAQNASKQPQSIPVPKQQVKQKPKNDPLKGIWHCPKCEQQLHQDKALNVWWCKDETCEFGQVVDGVALLDYPDPADQRTHMGSIFEFYDISVEDADEVPTVP